MRDHAMRAKNRTGRRVALTAWGVAAALIVTILGGQAYGYRLNITASAPIGLWRTVGDGTNLQRGMLVEICPPQVSVTETMRAGGYLHSGNCPAGTVPLLKPVAALEGDKVDVSGGQSIRVNGRVLPRTEAMPGFSQIEDGSYTVAAGMVWILSSYDNRSFDSRYFGAVPVENIRAQVVPVMVQGDPQLITFQVITEAEQWAVSRD